MTKLFRNIRFKLMEENKSGKYLKYALGEILLVVIGILIALSINNWNQTRLNKNLESQYLTRLLEDVKVEKLILESTLSYSKQVTAHAKDAIAVLENSPNADPDPVENLIDLYQASQLQDPASASSTYRELISSGQINLIQNENLKTSLIRYYQVDWSDGGIFSLENPYRKNLRGKMPDGIQSEIRANCNDIYLRSDKDLLFALPENCEITIDPNYAKSVVAELRQDESLKKDLRYIIGNEAGKQNDLQTEVIKLEELKALIESLIKA
ncbi:DUF6090 family protein [Algoriphagus namhaensis]|uniref:DUF6090 family protein n=1 Tax=Algoriphagus namhaensis TaxID=915353 RepID=A0ABV8AQ87_9BACT